MIQPSLYPQIVLYGHVRRRGRRLFGTVPEARLQIGKRIQVPGPDGTQVEATLERGIVVPNWKAASCVVCVDDETRFIVQIPLTDGELQAYAQHPTTFFGVIDRNAGLPMAKAALDCFASGSVDYALPGAK